jgi:transcriptional regulator with XRE-family HTH domain
MSTTEAAPGVAVPEFDLADRMRKALRTSGVGVQEMADYLGVARNTVSTWINGRIEPSTQTKRLWALRTGVSFEWLEHGEVTPANDEGTRAATTRGSLGKLVTLGEVSAMNTLPAQSVTAAA